ncbi:MAG: purine/pyrimidine permease [Desulfobacterales bacterium]|nr:purine/pyrimidine permease [Desulfobacterales bacterium]
MRNPVDLSYGVNDRPPWLKNLLYGFQWTVIFLPTILIISSISSDYLGLQGSEKVLFFQRNLLLTGGVVILQTLWGHRYPILDGPSTAVLLSLLILAPYGMEFIQGGMIAGGCFLLVLSFSGFMRSVENLFTDNVIGVIFILIAVTLFPYVSSMMIGLRPGFPSGEPIVFFISILVMIAIVLMSHWLPGFPRTLSLLLGIIFGTLLNWVLGRMNMIHLGETPWVSLPRPLVPGPPKFSLMVTLTFLVAYIAVMVNGLGTIYTVGEIVGAEGMASRVKRGIAATGLGGILAGILGGIGTVSFGLSAGVILVTRTGSRFTVTLCGFLLLLLAFFQKFMAIIAAVPASVVGAAMVVGLAAQVGAGISLFTRSGRNLDGRDYLVIGIPITMGGIISILPGDFFKPLPSTVHALLKNGLIVGIVLVLLLEHILLHRKGNDRNPDKIQGEA